MSVIDITDDRQGAVGLAALADLEVAVATIDAALPVDDPNGAEIDRAVAWVDGLLAAANKPGEVALARWVAAVVAERSGEPLAAESDLSLAVDADPRFPPAVDRAAWYASDQGDADAAARLWRRLSNADPADLAMVERFSGGPGRMPRRNDPCWCDSGQKYKQCHIGQPAPAPLADRVPWLWHKALSYVERRGGAAKDQLVAAVSALAADPDDHASLEAAFRHPLVVDAVLVEGRWFERFVADRGSLLPEDEARLAAAWALIPRTVYEIVEADLGGTVIGVRDLRSGDWLEVRAPSAGRLPAAGPGSLLCARAVPDGTGHQFVGATFPVLTGAETAVLDLCDTGRPAALCAWAAGAGQLAGA